MAKSGANVLKEFLVAVGFDVDLSQFKQFQDKGNEVVDVFESITKGAIATGVAVAAATLKIASDMEQLYFSSELAGTSIRALMDLRFGGAQAGVGADRMAATIERMASMLRMNPGLGVFFGAGGPGSDDAKNFLNIVTKLHEMDLHGGGLMARIIGQQLGIDEQTLTLLFKNWPDFIRGLHEQDDLLEKAGINAQEFGEHSHEAMEDWRVMNLHLKVLGDILAINILPTVDKIVVFLTKAIDLLGITGSPDTFWPSMHPDVPGSGIAKNPDAPGAGIAKEEGFRSNVYPDIAGNPTIGYGHKIRPGEDFSGGITQPRAAELFIEDRAAAQDAVLRMVKVAVNSNQFAALTDLMFNVGPAALAKSTLLKDLNSGDYAGAADQMLRFNHAMVNGHLQTVPDLTSRRIAELEAAVKDSFAEMRRLDDLRTCVTQRQVQARNEFERLAFQVRMSQPPEQPLPKSSLTAR